MADGSGFDSDGIRDIVFGEERGQGDGGGAVRIDCTAVVQWNIVYIERGGEMDLLLYGEQMVCRSSWEYREAEQAGAETAKRLPCA